MKNRKINEGKTMIAVMIKNNPQLPPSPSTIAPEDEAKSVLPAVPTEAKSAY